jgi:hypothetical protein
MMESGANTMSKPLKPIAIIDRGRGPELAGTRITIFDLLPFFREGWHHASIGLWFNISSAQVLALKEYFEENREEVLAMEEKIRQRRARGNPPEIEAKREASRAKLEALRLRLLEERKAREANHEGNSR